MVEALENMGRPIEKARTVLHTGERASDGEQHLAGARRGAEILRIEPARDALHRAEQIDRGADPRLSAELRGRLGAA